jgi:hypothetical protein
MKPYPKPVKKEKPKPSKIKPRSDKRAKQEREYLKMLPKFFEENPICQVNGCNLESSQCHHKKGRLGALLTNKKYFMAVCAEHHEKIETQPNWAKANGYSLSRLQPLKKTE